MPKFISPFDGKEYERSEDLFSYRAPMLKKKFISIDLLSPQNFLMYFVVWHSINEGAKYNTLFENLYSLELEKDNTFFWLGNADGDDDGIDAIAQAEQFKDGYVINIIGKTQKVKFPNREEKDLIIALSKLFPIYSGEIISFKMFAIWKELSEAGVTILVHDVFDEILDKVITCDELNYYFDPAIDTKRFRFKVNQSVDQKRKQ